MRKVILAGMALLYCLFAPSTAQQTAKAQKATGILVDGLLNEDVWKSAGKIHLRYDRTDHPSQHPPVTDDNDASAKFALLWNDRGLYCASWCKDDIHNAPWTNQPGQTHVAWNDDGHEWWITPDFQDAWEDVSPPYYGQFGWQVWKGWTWKDGAPTDKYVAYRNDNEPINTTTADLKNRGFSAPFTSEDGIDFHTEAHWEWSSFLLGNMSTPKEGAEIGFNISLTDNDGGEMASAWIRWVEGNQGTYQSWGKVVLKSKDARIRPVRVSFSAARSNRIGPSIHDVFGRRISESVCATQLVFFRETHTSLQRVKRAIVLR